MKRRSFMKSVGASGLIAGLPVSSAIADEKKLELKQGDVILFQGDSITDAGRQKKDPVANDGLGRGYPNVIAKSLLEDYSNLGLKIHNRGISGNKVPDLDRRWQADWAGQPDFGRGARLVEPTEAVWLPGAENLC